MVQRVRNVVFETTVVNLRELGVTATTSAAFNTNAILTALNLAGTAGTVVVPNFGNNQPVNHLGFSIPLTAITLTGENPRSFDTSVNTYGAALACIDNTAVGIGINPSGAFAGLSVAGLTISNLTISGGFFGLRTNVSGGVTQGFAYNNVKFAGPFGRTALAFSGHNEHGRLDNVFFQSVGNNVYAIEWLNEPQGGAALADILFDYIWIYGGCKVGVYLVNENPQETIQGVEFRNIRITQQNYCAVAIRAPCAGLLFSRGIGSEAGNILVPSGSKVDLFVDTNQYGSPVVINSPQLTVVGAGSALNAPDFPILNRSSNLTLDLTPSNSSQLLTVANSVGIGVVINDLAAAGQSRSILANGTDPGTGVDSHLTTYLGNLGSNQPIFDYWPRAPMVDDSAASLQLFHEDADDDYDLML